MKKKIIEETQGKIHDLYETEWIAVIKQIDLREILVCGHESGKEH